MTAEPEQLLRSATERVSSLALTLVVREDANLALRAHDAFHGVPHDETGLRAEQKVTRRRIWWQAPDALREETDTKLVVRDGPWWRRWDTDWGTDDNGGDPNFKTDAGEPVIPWWIDPTETLPFLAFDEVQERPFAGRAALAVKAVPSGARDAYELAWLGNWADRYELAVDAELGVVLGTAAFFGERAFRVLAAEEVAFNEPIPSERFEFQAREDG